MSITINLVSIPVDDQAKALAFYTEKLDFEKHADVPTEGYRWLTVTAPAGHSDVELVLEPNANPAAKTYQEALHSEGIPVTAFFSVASSRVAATFSASMHSAGLASADNASAPTRATWISICSTQ